MNRTDIPEIPIYLGSGLLLSLLVSLAQSRGIVSHEFIEAEIMREIALLGLSILIFYKNNIMGLQEVKDEILNEAEEKASRIKEEGETEADEIIESAEQEAEQIKEDTKEEIEEEKQALKQKEISKAEMDAKKKVQHSRQKSVIDKTMISTGSSTMHYLLSKAS
ncbi:hypothetical protein HRED_07419 [Candidatus Haloredivivus sp. G17]|nr:hypothetical protein HRED_07419 [Candidatus Haloredivivus sp. G17]